MASSSQPEGRDLRSRAVLVATSAVALGLSLGAVAGFLVGWLRPSESLGWSALAALPAWFALELYLVAISESIASISSRLRIVAPASVLIGFYAAWFVVRAGA